MDINNYFPLVPLTTAAWMNLLPLLTITFGALLCLIFGTHKERGHAYAFIVAFIYLVLAIFQCVYTLMAEPMVFIGGALHFTPFTRTSELMILVFALIGITITFGQDKKEGLLAEVYALILFSAAGMMLMVSTTHLLFMFIALEIMSLAIYVLVAMRRSSRFSSEAGLKYFILGGLASAMFLYGASLVFGTTGSFELATIQQQLTKAPQVNLLFLAGTGLILAGMLFKVGAFPFHGWLPDVYQGAATNITGFMGAAVKFTAFVALLKIAKSLIFVSGVSGLNWFQNLIWLCAAASMIYGNIVAISQTELKRMLAFSTIAHTGYLLLGLYAMKSGRDNSEQLIIYLFFYALANLGAFAIISLFEERNQKDLHLEQITGLGIKHPWSGLMLTIFILSMAGIPLTSGFIGKYGLFSSAVNSGEIPLVVIAVLTSVVSVYYYLRVIVYMFMKDSTQVSAGYHHIRGASIAAFVSAAATIQFGLFPKAVVHFIKLITR